MESKIIGNSSIAIPPRLAYIAPSRLALLRQDRKLPDSLPGFGFLIGIIAVAVEPGGTWPAELGPQSFGIPLESASMTVQEASLDIDAAARFRVSVVVIRSSRTLCLALSALSDDLLHHFAEDKSRSPMWSHVVCIRSGRRQ